MPRAETAVPGCFFVKRATPFSRNASSGAFQRARSIVSVSMVLPSQRAGPPGRPAAAGLAATGPAGLPLPQHPIRHVTRPGEAVELVTGDGPGVGTPAFGRA